MVRASIGLLMVISLKEHFSKIKDKDQEYIILKIKKL